MKDGVRKMTKATYLRKTGGVPVLTALLYRRLQRRGLDALSSGITANALRALKKKLPSSRWCFTN